MRQYQPTKHLGFEDSRSAMRELNVLWTQSHSFVLSYIRSVVVDFHRADDVLQETAATIAEKFAEYDRSRPFAAWALAIAKIKILEHFRSVSRDNLVFSEEVVEALVGAYARFQPELSDTHIGLERCMAKLGGRPKVLLERRYLRQEPLEVVASGTDMTPSAVRVALHRIRKSLLQCIESYLASTNCEQPLPRGNR